MPWLILWKKPLKKRRIISRDNNKEMTRANPPSLGIFFSFKFLSSKLLRILYFLEDEASNNERKKEKRQDRPKAAAMPIITIDISRLNLF